MRDYRCGSIWLVKFDPAIGTKIKKTRPALIISPTDFNRVRSKVTLLPISSATITQKVAPVVVKAIASAENGLDKDSMIVVIEPNTFDKRRLIKCLGQLESNLFAEVQSILKFYLNL